MAHLLLPVTSAQTQCSHCAAVGRSKSWSSQLVWKIATQTVTDSLKTFIAHLRLMGYSRLLLTQVSVTVNLRCLIVRNLQSAIDVLGLGVPEQRTRLVSPQSLIGWRMRSRYWPIRGEFKSTSKRPVRDYVVSLLQQRDYPLPM